MKTNPWAWIAKNPSKAGWLFLGLVTFGAFLGWAAPGLAPIVASAFDRAGSVVGILLAIPLAVAILATAFRR